MDWNEHKKALEKVLTDMSKEFGEPYIGKLIANTLAEMKPQYNTPNHTLCDTIRDCDFCERGAVIEGISVNLLEGVGEIDF